MLRFPVTPMNVKRTVTIALVGGALAAWLAGAATSNRDLTPPPTVDTHPIEMKGAALASEIARLHERLRPEVSPRESPRNLFAFRAAAPKPVPVPAAPKAALSEAIPPALPPQPALKLVGIAEDTSGAPDDADGQKSVRTAIIAGEGQLFLVKEGESVTTRYRVAKISADVVELTDLGIGATRRLALK
ncbi:MAG TPA: hypothetical protein VNZ26_00805 [Vicinamibacterales bacterium]|jgi:hypothetical protein|nr:hypothetical protein [Vicinamibacterales bacterium]